MKKEDNKKVAVFSASNEGTGEYIELAESLGKALTQNNFTTVNGGGPGLMELVARGAHREGGEVVGIHFEHEGRQPSKHNTETISYKELQPRQQKIISLADAFVVLPGGLGTAFELLEVLAKKHLGEKKVPIILVSHEFWDDLLKMMEKQIKRGFMSEKFLENFKIVDSAEEVVGELNKELKNEVSNEFKLKIK